MLYVSGSDPAVRTIAAGLFLVYFVWAVVAFTITARKLVMIDAEERVEFDGPESLITAQSAMTVCGRSSL